MTDAQALPVAIVTGATGGLGRWIARGLATAGYHVAIIGRDKGRLEAASAWMRKQVAGASIATFLADLSSLRETSEVGKKLLQSYPKIALLVTNAGIFAARREETPEGHERVLAVNHLSPFLLTNILVPALIAASPSRIVAVGSDTSDRASIDPDNLELTQGWNYLRAYRRSKLAQMMTTFELAGRLRGTGVTANVVHPGGVATGLIRTKGVIGLAWKLMAPFLLTEEQGAKAPLDAALNKAFAQRTGIYIKRMGESRPNPIALSAAKRLAVWNATETCLSLSEHPSEPSRRSLKD